MTTPRIRTTVKSRITAPPRIRRARRTASVVPEVRTVLGRVSLMDRFTRIGRILLPSSLLSQVLPDPVEHHDGVVQGVPDDGQKGRHRGQGDLDPEEGQEPKGQKDVVEGGDDGRDTESELEPDGDVDEGKEEGEEDGEGGFLLKLTPDLGAHQIRFQDLEASGSEGRARARLRIPAGPHPRWRPSMTGARMVKSFSVPNRVIVRRVGSPQGISEFPVRHGDLEPNLNEGSTR